MAHITPENLEPVVAHYIKTALAEGRAVEIPGWGMLSVVHHSASLRTNAEGKAELVPPRDEIVFTPVAS